MEPVQAPREPRRPSWTHGAAFHERQTGGLLSGWSNRTLIPSSHVKTSRSSQKIYLEQKPIDICEYGLENVAQRIEPRNGLY